MKSTEARLYIDGVLAAFANPIFSDKISIDKERESGEMFRRTKLNSEFQFVGDAYDRIFDCNLDTDFEIRVYDKETNIQLARGTFEKTDCKFDTDNKICTVKTNSADEYDKILAGMNDEFDLVGLAPVREKVKLAKRGILQIYFRGDNKVTNVIGNMSYEIDTKSSVLIGTSDVAVENLTETQLVNNLSFTKMNIDAFFLGLTGEMAIEFPNASGRFNFYGIVQKQVGSQTVSDYRYTNINGQYYVDFTDFFEGRTGVLWRASDNTVVYDSHGYAIYFTWLAGAQEKVLRQSVYAATGAFTLLYECGSLVDFTKGVFLRVLLDNPNPTTPMGTIRKLTSENDLCSFNLNYRYTMPVSISGIENKFIVSFAVQNEPTKWGVNGDGKYFVQPTPLSTGDNVIPVGWDVWIPASFWFNSTSGIADTLDLYNMEWELNDAYPLWSAIKVLLAKIDPSITFEGTSTYSQFLYGTISSSVILGWVKQLLYITPITNVKKTYYNQAARKGKITLKQIFDMLRATCQLYWFIDSSNRLRIEHITWFRNGGNYSQQNPLIDLTSILSPMSRKNWSFGQNTFEYDKSALSKRYEFSWHEECSEVFDGFPIDIKNKYASKGNTEKSQATNFISDIDLIFSAPDALGDDSFALIGTDNNKRCPIQSIGNFGMDFVAPTYKMQNPYLSFYYTELAYWLYNISGNKATTSDYKKRNGNDGKLRVYAVKRAKTQSVKFPITPDKAGKEGLITTALGTGEWTKSKYTSEDGMVDMEIIMETAEPLLVEYGSFTHLSTGVMELDVEEGGHQMIFTFDGGERGATDWGYVKVVANRDVNVELESSTEGDPEEGREYDIGWANPTPLTTSATSAQYRVSGNPDFAHFSMQRGDIMYFGYTKDASVYGGEDKIYVRFVEI